MIYVTMETNIRNKPSRKAYFRNSAEYILIL